MQFVRYYSGLDLFPLDKLINNYLYEYGCRIVSISHCHVNTWNAIIVLEKDACLYLSEDRYDKALSGIKTATSWKGYRDIKEGPLLIARTEHPNDNFMVNVTSVNHIMLDGINEMDAKKEGYDSLDELKEVLRSIYPDIDGRTVMTLIAWERLEI